MILPKKALGSSIIVIVGFSFVLSMLLFAILTVSYSDRHEYCSEISFSSQANCETRSDKIRITFRNDGTLDMYYEINSELDSKKNIILAGKLNELEFEAEPTYKIVPHVLGDDGNLYACLSQVIYTSSGGLPKCN